MPNAVLAKAAVTTATKENSAKDAATPAAKPSKSADEVQCVGETHVSQERPGIAIPPKGSLMEVDGCHAIATAAQPICPKSFASPGD